MIESKTSMKKNELIERPVCREEYLGDYDSPLRFLSYLEQINYIKKIKPKKLLEIGVGNRLVLNYAKELGIDTSGLDKNEDLVPDIVADVRKMPLKSESFDMISICEVLEHMPFEDFERTLRELHRVSSKYVLISLPYASIVFDVMYKFPLIRTLTKRQFFEFYIRIPVFWKRHKFDKKHYWEMGKKGYPINKIRRIVRKYFVIRKESSPPIHKYHYFFLLEKRT